MTISRSPATSDAPWLFVVAGEASGDLHGAEVLRELAARSPGARFFGLGGERMQARGLERIGGSGPLNVVGLTEVLRGLAAIRRLRDRLLEELDGRRTAAALLIDLPGFNLHLARCLKARAIPVVYYIAPQAWAWRRGRVRKIRRRVDRLCAIFPFEEAFFARHGVAVEYVGHPLTERARDRAAEAPRRVAIVPGSRPREIERLLPPLAAAARLLAGRLGPLDFRLPLAPGIDRGRVEGVLDAAGIRAEIVTGGAARALEGARLGLVCSGTAALEAALCGVPSVVVYRVSALSYAAVRPFFRLPHVCIVNILAGEALLPELLQSAVRPERIADEAAALFDDGERRARCLAGMREVTAGLGQGRPSARVAEILAGYLAPAGAGRDET
ncbi:MAG: lipid-A-disaccharide synthase [Deltaproteobacteria bacterium]|nr:lipid-A-disaccharide synthase [Deltaproteobacteria bacterium]